MNMAVEHGLTSRFSRIDSNVETFNCWIVVAQFCLRSSQQSLDGIQLWLKQLEIVCYMTFGDDTSVSGSAEP